MCQMNYKIPLLCKKNSGPTLETKIIESFFPFYSATFFLQTWVARYKQVQRPNLVVTSFKSCHDMNNCEKWLEHGQVYNIFWANSLIRGSLIMAALFQACLC